MKAGNGTEEVGYANVELKSQLKPSQSRKESICTELFIDRKLGLYIPK